MTADEMFEKLGYRREETTQEMIYYGELFTIEIDLEDRIICTGDGDWINTEELQAIYKKCEELGWYD